jgi:multiple sugar transport system permease protein
MNGTERAGVDGEARNGLIAVRYPRFSAGSVVSNLALAFLGALFFFPLLWLLFASVDSSATLGLKLPHVTFRYFEGIITGSSLDYQTGLHSFRNSLFLAGVATAITTPIALIAAYPLSRKRIPLKRPLLFAILFATALPVTILLVPIFQIYIYLGWLNKLTTTALFFAASALPFAIWIIKSAIDAVPIEIEEAAALEGAGTSRTIRSVVLPLIAPSVGVCAMYTFVNAWGAFLIPFVLDNRTNDQPGTIAIFQFIGAHGNYRFGPIAAFSILFSLPVIALYVLIARTLGRGFSFAGGVKG